MEGEQSKEIVHHPRVPSAPHVHNHGGQTFSQEEHAYHERGDQLCARNEGHMYSVVMCMGGGRTWMVEERVGERKERREGKGRRKGKSNVRP